MDIARSKSVAYALQCFVLSSVSQKDSAVNNIIYIVGLVVIILFVLGWFGFR